MNDKRTSADNYDLDIVIAEVLELTVDQVNAIPSEALELLRELVWKTLATPMVH